MSQSILIDELPEELRAVLTELETSDLSQALSHCRQVIREGVRAAFSAAVDPQTGQAWAPRKRPYPHPPLMKTQTMAMAAVGLGSGSVGTIEGRVLRVGVSSGAVAYAPFHQFGTGRMVARPFMGASEQTLDACGEILADAGLMAFE